MKTAYQRSIPISGLFPPGKNLPLPRKHLIATSSFATKPMWIECECNWRGDAHSSSEVERLWKLHKSEQQEKAS